MIHIKYRTCVKCNRHAFLLITLLGEEMPLCLDCLEEAGRYSRRRYVCSVKGCRSSPRVLAALDDECEEAVLLCIEHLQKLEAGMKFVFPLPLWLTDDGDVFSCKEGVIFEWDVALRANSIGT